MYEVKKLINIKRRIRESYFFFKHKADMFFCLITSNNNTRYPNYDVLKSINYLSKHIFQFFLIVTGVTVTKNRQKFLNSRN